MLIWAALFPLISECFTNTVKSGLFIKFVFSLVSAVTFSLTLLNCSSLSLEYISLSSLCNLFSIILCLLYDRKLTTVGHVFS